MKVGKDALMHLKVVERPKSKVERKHKWDHTSFQRKGNEEQ